MINTPNVWSADVIIKFNMDADVFYVAESSIPGLCAESAELDDLLVELETLIPEMRKAKAISRIYDMMRGFENETGETPAIVELPLAEMRMIQKEAGKLSPFGDINSGLKEMRIHGMEIRVQLGGKIRIR